MHMELSTADREKAFRLQARHGQGQGRERGENSEDDEFLAKVSNTSTNTVTKMQVGDEWLLGFQFTALFIINDSQA